ncbi:holo-ACP synthase [Granulicoccus phenolivorans]|uniref:holo-ACP synthase n=1 Tax=Granulicoccus phenolivorans TaxID=266854 RepID=UPI0003FA510D|nr:holo-ACP synthase [Granulicoccus phenolivorans]
MIVGIGVDVCAIDRFAAAEQRRPGFARRYLTEAEAALSMPSQAARFAAKEALAKALRIEHGLGWHDAEVVCDQFGRPEFAITGSVAARARVLGVTRIHLSMSHDAGIATAYVICEGER